MPEVGKKKFPYTKAGKKAAKAYARESGQGVEKYQYGGSVDPFSTKNPSGVPAKQVKEVTEKQNMSKNLLNAIPTTDAQDRSEVSPDTTEYKEGGAVGPAGDPRYAPRKGQKSTLMRNKPKKEYELMGLLAIEKKQPKPKKKKSKAKSENVAAINKPKLKKELKQADPSGKTSKRSKKYFEDEPNGRA